MQSGGAWDRAVTAPGARGVQIGNDNTQNNYYSVAEHVGQHEAPGMARLVVGDVPQEPAAFQPRPGLVTQLEATGGSRGSVVFSVTGIRGSCRPRAGPGHRPPRHPNRTA